MKPNAGFTLIELLIAVVVLSVLASLAAPNFQNVIDNTRQVTYYNKVASTLRYARSEAIKRSAAVSVCARATDTSCGTDWTKGMLVFLDPDNGTVLSYDAADTTLRKISLPESGITMTASALLVADGTPTASSVVRFNGRGQPNWLNGTVVLCDRRGTSDARALIMTGSGIGRRAYSTSSSNGVATDARGTAVSCS